MKYTCLGRVMLHAVSLAPIEVGNDLCSVRTVSQAVSLAPFVVFDDFCSGFSLVTGLLDCDWLVVGLSVMLFPVYNIFILLLYCYS